MPDFCASRLRCGFVSPSLSSVISAPASAVCGALDHVGRRRVQRAVAGEDVDLDPARVLEPVDQVERLRDARAAREETVVVQDHRVALAEVAHEALLLAAVERRALVVVVREVAVEAHGRLRQRHQAFRQRAHRDARPGVRVNDAHDVVARLVHRAVDDVAGRVHRVVEAVRLRDHVAGEVDLDQAGGGDLLVQHAVGVDQDVVLRPGDARGDVVVDEVGHAVARDQPVARGEVDAHVPFGRAHAVAHRGGAERQDASHHCLLRRRSLRIAQSPTPARAR